MASAGAAMSFCPTSNLFLGSGLFDVGAARAHGVRVGLGTDVGGGTSLSMLRTQTEAYKIVQLAGGRLTPLSTLYHVYDRFGLVRERAVYGHCIYLVATPLLARRIERAATLPERLFAWTVLGDDRSVAATYLMGRRQNV